MIFFIMQNNKFTPKDTHYNPKSTLLSIKSYIYQLRLKAKTKLKLNKQSANNSSRVCLIRVINLPNKCDRCHHITLIQYEQSLSHSGKNICYLTYTKATHTIYRYTMAKQENPSSQNLVGSNIINVRDMKKTFHPHESTQFLAFILSGQYCFQICAHKLVAL